MDIEVLTMSKLEKILPFAEHTVVHHKIQKTAVHNVAKQKQNRKNLHCIKLG